MDCYILRRSDNKIVTDQYGRVRIWFEYNQVEKVAMAKNASAKDGKTFHPEKVQ